MSSPSKIPKTECQPNPEPSHSFPDPSQPIEPPKSWLKLTPDEKSTVYSMFSNYCRILLLICHHTSSTYLFLDTRSAIHKFTRVPYMHIIDQIKTFKIPHKRVQLRLCPFVYIADLVDILRTFPSSCINSCSRCKCVTSRKSDLSKKTLSPFDSTEDENKLDWTDSSEDEKTAISNLTSLNAHITFFACKTDDKTCVLINTRTHSFRITQVPLREFLETLYFKIRHCMDFLHLYLCPFLPTSEIRHIHNIFPPVRIQRFKNCFCIHKLKQKDRSDPSKYWNDLQSNYTDKLSTYDKVMFVRPLNSCPSF